MLTIRKAKIGDERGIAEVHVTARKTTYSGLIPASYLKTLSIEKRTASWATAIKQTDEKVSQKAIFVCEDHTGVIQGFISGGVERELGCDWDAELYAVYIYENQQGKGIGRRLTRELASWLVQAGFKKMRVWVLEDNPSRRFYESLGARVLPQSKNVEFAVQQCAEVAYG